MLSVGEFVRGSYWPETVEVKKCERVYGSYYILEALGRKSNAFYQMLLGEHQLNTIERLSINADIHTAITNAKELQHYLQYFALKVDQRYSVSRSLGSNQILPLPHQIDAVYRRMLQTSRVRFLLADDPGAGKTIMSGMLIRELRARKSADRILILAPPLVLTQWQEELKEKFNEEFTIINRAVVETLNGQNPFEHYSLSLASMHWAARDEIKGFILDAHFDLVIVDEAHKMAAYTHGKKKRSIQRTRLYRLGESLLRHVPHCLLLTATPHKGDMENYRHLLRLLDQDVFSHLRADETIREKGNPYVIRRLKESMVNFDGKPIFPKRTTKTIEFHLSPPELELYEGVTAYVQEHFNRAISNGSHSTAFAMMVLQRRLSSSTEAIYLSLKRRRERLEKLYHETVVGEVSSNEASNLNIEEYEEMSTYDQVKVEEQAEGSVVKVDTNELREELAFLDELYKKSSMLREGIVERKYLELETILFGPQGLISKGEKVLIFTEYTDTLNYLYELLSPAVPKIAVISGEYSVERRRQQVELFRTDAPIMLATDAGGESINLQFCNQMINFDIPWNPNRLEQRMGRIHRIGQKNEVFVFNFVAKNTREGDVLIHLLTKMEQMREDLGQDLVYDFIGEMLEDEDLDLSKFIQNAVVNRENLDQHISKLDEALLKEHNKIIKQAQSEQLDETGFNLSSIRKEQQDIAVKSLPIRVYANFFMNALSDKRVKVHESSSRDVYRIEHFPRQIREFASKNDISLDSKKSSYRFTTNKMKQSFEVELMHNDHPLFELGMAFTEEKIQSIALQAYRFNYPISERLIVEVYEVETGDGTAKELSRTLLYLAKRKNGELIKLDPYWIFHSALNGSINTYELTGEPSFFGKSLEEGERILSAIQGKRESALIKKQQFLRRVFESQYENVLKRLSEFRQSNLDNQNHIQINQLKSQLEEIVERREERLQEVLRERSVYLKPLKRLTQLELLPVVNKTACVRIFPHDWLDIVKEYEAGVGRINVRAFDALGLVDFYSENYNGESKFIILGKEDMPSLSKEHLQDLLEIKEHTYIYVCKSDRIVKEYPLSRFY
jgi:superfamily II DNA or RNA helicase